MDDALIGTKINRYEIQDCLHKTDLLGLYKVYDTKLERHVLMKLVFHSSQYSQEFIEYFLSESRSLAKMSHASIARVLDFGYDSGNLYLISEYHSGRTIAEMMGRPIPWQRVIETLLPVADALTYAHGQGIIHRDLKPENIVLTEDDRLMLSDFSLIRIIESEETRDMTGTNVGLGSPAYISPEQGKGLAVDFRSDIYSLGIIFFEMVTGQKPFSGDTSMEMVIQHVTAAPPSPRKIVHELPELVEKIILTALAKDAEQRYQTMEEFARVMREALEQAGQTDVKSRARIAPRMLAGYAAIAVIVLLFSGWIVRSAFFSATPTPTEDLVASKPSASPTVLVVASSTPTPALPTASPTLQNRFPVSAFSLPAIPALPGTPIPDPSTAIDKGNAGSLVELARWGNPDISHFAFIQNGQALLAATSGGVYYFDPSNLTSRYFFDTKGSLSAFAVSADEEWVATGDVTGHIYVWNIKDGSEVAAFQADSTPIKTMDFSPDRSMLVSNAIGKTARVWDLNQKSQLVTLEGHGLNINRVAFSPDGETAVSGGDDFKIIVWDVYSGAILKKLTSSKKINDLSLSSDGSLAALAMSNATIEIWDLKSGGRINTISAPSAVDPFTFVKFLPNDQLILSGSEDGVVRVWNAQSTDMLWAASYQDATGAPIRQTPVRSLSVSDNGAKFTVLFEDGHAELWNLVDQKLELSVPMQFKPVERLAISWDGNLLAYQGGDAYVAIWSIPNATRRAQMNAVLPRGYPFSQNSQQILLHSADLKLYSLAQPEPSLLFTYLDVPSDAAVNFLQEDKLVAMADGNLLRYWSTSSGLELRPGDSENTGSCRAIFSREGTFLAVGSSNGLITMDQNLAHFCQVRRGPRTLSESYLPDGSIIALSQENQAVDVWNLQSGNQGVTLHSETPGDMLGVAISDDGQLLAAASESGVVEIYDLNTQELLGTLDLHTGPIKHILFSHDGKYIITGSADGIVRFFGLRP